MTLVEPPPWEPILEGRLARAAIDAVRGIADLVVSASDDEVRPHEHALFWAYTGRLLDDDRSADLLAARVVDTLTWLRREPRPAGLLGGEAGAGWTLSHLQAPSRLLAAIDRRLQAHLAQWEGSPMLADGLAGVGLYFLERRRANGALEVAHRGLTAILDRLEAASPASTDPGAAHGVSGVLGFLGLAAEDPFLAPRAVALSRGWAASTARPTPVALRTPAPLPDRTAWCYGDAGIVGALWAATRRLGGDVAPWVERAREIASRTLTRCRLEDATLCHGAAGLAHLLNRWYQTTRDPVFRLAAVRWFERALVGGALGGWCATGRLLDGAGGIGLALLAAVGNSEPGWDRLLLSDLPIA
jgi:lantibiotic biosynthesis protein